VITEITAVFFVWAVNRNSQDIWFHWNTCVKDIRHNGCLTKISDNWPINQNFNRFINHPVFSLQKFIQ